MPIVAVLALTTALSTGGSNQLAPTQAPEAPKLKCEKIVVLGSRMPVRVCRTPEQIAAQKRETEDTMRHIRGDLMESPPPEVKR